jgi:DNA (cytosine-5)-methyltransferase 1
MTRDDMRRGAPIGEQLALISVGNVRSEGVREWRSGPSYSWLMGHDLGGPHAGSALRFIDLFAGAGGISEGFRQAGLRALLGSDIDPDACATYAVNFPEAAVVCGDLRDREVEARILDVGAGADIVAGGPPCQAFSQVRNHARLIDDPRNRLYREFVSVVGSLEPRGFVMENVPGMAQMRVTEQVLEDLGCGGRYVVAPCLVDAADFGVPQTRKRIVFIGLHRDLGVDPPKLQGTDASAGLTLSRPSRRRRYAVTARDGDSELVERLADPWDAGLVSVEQAIGDLCWLPAGHRLDVVEATRLGEPLSAYQKELRDGVSEVVDGVSVPRINKDTVMRLAAVPPGGNHLDLPDDLTNRFLTGERWGQDNGSGKLSRKHFYAYRRLHPQMWSWTLNTKADSVYHYVSHRALSVREFARIQSFPDRFVVTTDPRRGPLPGRIEGGAAHSRYRQVGNAVPPRLARAIAEAVATTLS